MAPLRALLLRSKCRFDGNRLTEVNLCRVFVVLESRPAVRNSEKIRKPLQTLFFLESSCLVVSSPLPPVVGLSWSPLVQWS